MKKYQVVINEQHSLLTEQENLLNSKFGDKWELFKVPASGWKLSKIQEVTKELRDHHRTAVFCSPIPAFIKEMSKTKFFLFHNDNRDKKELPNGKIIFVVSKTGWQLI